MTIATDTLPGAKITLGPQPWAVLQREADGCAPVVLEGYWVGEGASVVEVRVASEYDNAPVAGCDWQDAEMLSDHAWRITLRVPTGGLYRLETRVRAEVGEWRNTGDKIWHVSVGDLWVIAGQSNAAGYGHGPVVDPPALGVSVFGGNEEWRMATHPIFDPTGTKHPANRDGGWVDGSPWLAFGKEILQGAGVPVGLIPTALGGSPLCAWDPGNPDGAYLYENMLTHIDAGGGRVAGMVWYQGESDANEELVATYLLRFTRFVEAFRARYGTDLPVITVQLNRYLDSVPAQDRPWGMMREVQRQAARVIPQVAVVPSLDLALSDAIHTSAVGNVILGQRCGRAALGMVYGRKIPWQAVDVREAHFTDAARSAVRVSFDHVVDHLVFLKLQPADFTLEDAEGALPVTAARMDGNDTVLIELGRPAVGHTLCHNMAACDPPSTLRDHLQRPVLAFYGLEVADAQ
ncbi:MAG: sialate O-acetylesterase [Armatimonadota bacterium]